MKHPTGKGTGRIGMTRQAPPSGLLHVQFLQTMTCCMSTLSHADMLHERPPQNVDTLHERPLFLGGASCAPSLRSPCSPFFTFGLLYVQFLQMLNCCMSTFSHADLLHERPLQMRARCMSTPLFPEVLHVHLHGYAPPLFLYHCCRIFVYAPPLICTHL